MGFTARQTILLVSTFLLAKCVRENEVLELIALGKTTKEIAAVLEISHRTVGAHRSSIRNKLHIHTTIGLVRCALLRDPAKEKLDLMEEEGKCTTNEENRTPIDTRTLREEGGPG